MVGAENAKRADTATVAEAMAQEEAVTAVAEVATAQEADATAQEAGGKAWEVATTACACDYHGGPAQSSSGVRQGLAATSG